MMNTLDEPAFDTLRTKEQLGYMAYLQRSFSVNVMGGVFIIQSSVKDPEYLM